MIDDAEILKKITRLETQYRTVIKPMAKQVNEMYEKINEHAMFIDNAEKEIERVALEKLAAFQSNMVGMTKKTLDWRKVGALISVLTALLVFLMSKLF
jgi:hypothetical protein